MSDLNIVLTKGSAPFKDYQPDILRLFDEATLWLGSQGRTGQWGCEAPSGHPEFLERMTNFFNVSEAMNMTIIFARASEATPILGVLAFNDRPSPGSKAPPITEEEVYVHLLLTTRDPSYRGLGRTLVTEAMEEARRRNVGLLRLACYAGGDGKLIRVYERMGFEKIPGEIIFVKCWNDDAWPQVVMELRLKESL